MPVGEVLARRHQLALVLRSLLVLEPAPGGVELQERVLDEVARAHRVDYRTVPWMRRRCASAHRPADTVARVRIALVSPYSWTYPGGVTRHIEALADELTALGHEPRILAPFDPDDALSRRLHRGARPQRRELPERFVSLGRTVGLPANGAVSNCALTPNAVFTCVASSRGRLRRRAHPRAGRPAARLGRALLDAPSCHSWARSTPTRRTPSRTGSPPSARRPPAVEPPARPDRRLGRRRLDREALLRGSLQDHPQRRPPEATTALARATAAPSSREAPLRILFIGQAVERKGLPVLLRAFEALREHVPATLTLVGADPGGGRAHAARRSRRAALGKVSESEKHAELARARGAVRTLARGESFGMVLTEAFAAADARGRLRHPRLPRCRPGRARRPARASGRRARAGGGAAPARARPARARGWRARARARRALRLAACRGGSARLLRAGARRRTPRHARRRFAVRHGLAPADLLPRVPAQRLPSLPAGHGLRRRGKRRPLGPRAPGARCAALRARGLARWPRTRAARAPAHRRRPRAASLLASSPGLLAAGLGADVRLDVRPRPRLARDPRGGARPGAGPNAATRCRGPSSACSCPPRCRPAWVSPRAR